MFAKFSVKKPLTIFVAVFMVIILGVVSFTRMTPDLLPSINLPYAMVITTYPGATPEEIEGEISKPMEQAMASLENIDNISSVSAENVSQLMLQFNDSANMDAVVSEIREKINGVSGAWPDLVGTPYIIKINPDLLPVTVSAVEYAGMDNIALTQFLDTELMSKLEGISGVASVGVSGNVQEQISVILSADKLQQINDKIKKSLDKEFEEAQETLDEKNQELADGKAEMQGKEGALNSAKDQLEAGQSALADQSAQAQSQLLDKRLELEQAKTEINSKIGEANTTLALLRESEKQVTALNDRYQNTLSEQAALHETIASLTDLQSQHQSLSAQKRTLQEQIAALENQPTPAPTAVPQEGEVVVPDQPILPDTGELDSLRAELAGVEAQLLGVEAAMTALGTDPSGIAGKLLVAEGKRLVLDTVLVEIDAALAPLGISLASIGTDLTDLQDNIAKLEAGVAQMENTLTQLDSGAITLSAAIAELNRQQLSGAMQLSNGMSEILTGQGALTAAKGQLDAAQGQMDAAKTELDAQKEAAYDSANVTLTMDMINGILTAQNFSMPAGYLTESGVQYLVRVGDKITDVAQLQELLLFDTGIDDVGAVRLKDVAEVFLQDNGADIYAKINGSDGVILSFSKQSTYATATVSKSIAEKFRDLEAQYPGMRFSNLSDQGDYIDIVINSVLQNLLLGAVLAVLILLLFLKDLKPTIIIACSIPISLLFALVLMYFSGITLNVISLSGLAVGVGMLVDNSVVVIENIYRMRSEGKTALQAAVSGAAQVTGAIISSTLTTICVFLPIVFVEGLTRQLFQDMALTIAYSLLASLIVAVTLVPAMASGMMRREKVQTHKLFDKFLNGYEKLAKASLKHKWVVLTASVVLLAASTAICLQRGFIFMPSMSGTQISVTITAPENATFAEKTALADAVYERVSGIQELETVGIMVAGDTAGGGGMSMGSMGMGGGDISMYAIMKTNAGVKDTVISKEIVARCSDLDAEVTAQGAMDMSAYMSAMGGAGVTVKLYGTELDALITDAQGLVEQLNQMQGLQNATAGLEDATPELRITVNKDAAMTEGLTVAQVFQAVAAKVKTEATATALTLESFQKDIVVYSEENQNMTAADLRKLTITATDRQGKEKELPLSDLAQIHETKSLASITRENQRRALTISAEVIEGHNVTLVTDAARAALADFTPIQGNTLTIGGESDAIMDAMEQLIYMAILAVVIIYFIMVAQFQSFRSPFIVMFTIPLAFTGGFLALLLTGGTLSVISMVGFIMLAGIIVNNGIVLIDYINILRLEGMEKKAAILLAGRTRMRPILMTALTTVLGLVFMAIATGFGAEMMQPMAIVCIGGLLYATLMTLFVVPAMYDVLGRKEMKKREVE